jgi:prophage tail gpP-like protein
MAFEIVTLRVAGLGDLRPVTISIKKSLDEGARTFAAKVKVQDMTQAELLQALAGSPAAKIYSAFSDNKQAGAVKNGQSKLGELLLTGSVERRQPALRSAESELPISGRSKTGDLVDSSAESKTGEWKNKAAPEVFKDLTEGYDVTIESDFAHKPKVVFRVRPGETIHDAFDRWARSEGFTVTDTSEGKVKTTSAKNAKRHAGAIREGVTTWPKLLDGSGDLNDSKKFSQIKVKAQAPDGYSPADLEIEADAKDDTVKRKRLRIIAPPELVRNEDARERAKWHRDRAAGQGTKLNLKVLGWRDEKQQFWEPGWLITCEIPSLGVMQDMLIETVQHDQTDADNEGTVTYLDLVDPRAYGGKKGKGAKSGASWDTGKAGGDDT